MEPSVLGTRMPRGKLNAQRRSRQGRCRRLALERLEPRAMLSALGLLERAPPRAANDFYSTPADTPLVVAAPGVLANDYDPDGDPLEAFHLDGWNDPLHGWVSLRSDGSFIYVPDAGYNGPDQFGYWAIAGMDASAEATVTIDVGIFNHAPRVAQPIQDIAVAQGTATAWIDLAGVFEDADDPTGEQLSYSVTVSLPVRPVVDQVSQSSYMAIHQDLLYTHVGDNRGIGGPEHDLARDNIAQYLRSLSLEVSLETFTDWGMTMTNVIGVKPGVTRPEDIYILGAHYDSVGNPGADDNASGVAAVLEIARVLAPYPLQATVVFIAFDGEEQGLFGSCHYAEAHVGDRILGMVTPDMIAYNPAGERHNEVSLFDSDGAGVIKSRLLEAFAAYADGLTAVDAGVLDASDHAPFEWLGFDAALVIESAMESEPFMNPHYHEDSDAVETPDYIDYVYATQVTRGIAGYLVRAAGRVGTSDLVTASVVGQQVLLEFAPGLADSADITVRATDPGGLFAETSFSVVVRPVNRAPVANDDGYYTPTDAALVVGLDAGLLSNDTDPDADPIVATLISGPNHGTLALRPDGSFTYVPDPGYTGNDTFTYQAQDGQAGSNTASVSLWVGLELVAVYVEASGSPFGQAAGPTWPGATFWVNVYLEDLRSVPQGILGGAIDLLFDHFPLTPTGDLRYADAFSSGRQGTVDDEAGRIDEFGALTSLSLIGANGPAPFAACEFRRDGAGAPNDPNSAVRFLAAPAQGTGGISPAG